MNEEIKKMSRREAIKIGTKAVEIAVKAAFVGGLTGALVSDFSSRMAKAEGESPIKIVPFTDGTDAELAVWGNGRIDYKEYRKIKKNFSGKSVAVPSDGYHFAINTGRAVEIINRQSLQTEETWDTGREIDGMEWISSSRIVARFKGENGQAEKEFDFTSK